MVTLTLRNTDNSVNVQYKTDIIGENDNFTIMEVIGANDAEIASGINFRQEVHTVKELYEFAETNSLFLVKTTNASSTIIYSPTGYGQGLGESYLD